MSPTSRDPKAPPSGSAERRNHPRFEVFVEVEVGGETEIQILHARNISTGGLYLEVEEGVSGLELGKATTLVMQLGVDENGEPLTLQSAAEVVRQQDPVHTIPRGVGLRWKTQDEASASTLPQIIEFLKNR